MLRIAEARRRSAFFDLRGGEGRGHDGDARLAPEPLRWSRPAVRQRRHPALDLCSFLNGCFCERNVPGALLPLLRHLHASHFHAPILVGKPVDQLDEGDGHIGHHASPQAGVYVRIEGLTGQFDSDEAAQRDGESRNIGGWILAVGQHHDVRLEGLRVSIHEALEIRGSRFPLPF